MATIRNMSLLAIKNEFFFLSKPSAPSPANIRLCNGSTNLLFIFWQTTKMMWRQFWKNLSWKLGRSETLCKIMRHMDGGCWWKVSLILWGWVRSTARRSKVTHYMNKTCKALLIVRTHMGFAATCSSWAPTKPSEFLFCFLMSHHRKWGWN